MIVYSTFMFLLWWIFIYFIIIIFINEIMFYTKMNQWIFKL